MWLDEYYSENQEGVAFSRAQGSRFAKEVADDFNPLHDHEAKLFCVPGDLLFAFVLARYGVFQQMHFLFTGMVGADIPLRFPTAPAARFEVLDADGKSYLKVGCQGESSRDPTLAEALSRRYVEFSGRNFPGILVPLLAEQGVMMNPDRPLVIYESMEFEMQRLEFSSPELELSSAVLEVDGKKGKVRLDFELASSGVRVGRGTKFMAVRGLRPYDEARMSRLVDDYLSTKQSYVAEA